MAERDTPVIKAATNEWTLLVYRFVTMGCALVVTWYVTGIKDQTIKLSNDFAELKVAHVERMARIEGEVSALRGSVEVHRKRIEGNDTDIRSLWSRIFDLNNRTTPSSRAAP